MTRWGAKKRARHHEAAGLLVCGLVLVTAVAIVPKPFSLSPCVGSRPLCAAALALDVTVAVEDERRFIANAEAGKTGIWSVQPGKGKVDTTAAHVEISRRAVQALEGVIAKIDQDHLAE